MKAGRRTIEIGNPEKLLFPQAGVSKRDLADFYRDVAEVMLPHVRERFVSMQRLPDGIDGEGFYQKDVPDYFPDWIPTFEVEKEEGTLRQLVIRNAATLVYLVDQACVTPHVWVSRADRPRRPDRIVFDLDPPGDGSGEEFEEVRWVARRVREVIEEIGLVARVQTSGSRGLHVHVPVRRDADFEASRRLARNVARLLGGRHPDRITTEQRKRKRAGRVFIDVMRNAYGQTAVAPYSVRARAGAPVATPLDWDELGRAGMGPRRYDIHGVRRRLGQRADPWAGMGSHARSIDGPARRLADLEGLGA